MNKLKSFFPLVATYIFIYLTLPPISLSYLIFIAFVPFLIWINKRTLKSELITQSYTLGFIVFSTIFYGILESHGGLLGLFLLFSSLHFLLFALVSNLLLKSTNSIWSKIILIPSFWVSLEVIFNFFGVPTNIGLMLAEKIYFIQHAEFFGIYAVSFSVLLTNTLIFFFIKEKKIKWLVLTSLILLLIFAFSYYKIDIANNAHSETKVKVATIQPNIPPNQYLYYNRDIKTKLTILDTFFDLSQKVEKPDIIVWPENSFILAEFRIPKIRKALETFAHKKDSWLVIGSQDITPELQKFNSIFLISPEEGLFSKYNKVSPVPFTESEIKDGHEDMHIVSTKLGLWSLNICYESILLKRSLENIKSSLIFVLTNDSQIHYLLPIYHYYYSVFRAIESKSYLIHSSKTGLSGIINQYGMSVKKLGYQKKGILEENIPLINIQTFYEKFGRKMLLVFMLVTLSSIIFCLRKSKFSFNLNIKAILENIVPTSTMLSVALAFLCLNIFLLSPISFNGAIEKLFLTPPPPKEPISTNKYFLQKKHNTCGLSSLGYVFNKFGLVVDQGFLMTHDRLISDGLTLLDLKFISEENGFKAEGVRMDFDTLKASYKPILVHFTDTHYVVVNKISHEKVYTFDPSQGLVKFKKEEFLNRWSGKALIISPGKLPIE